MAFGGVEGLAPPPGDSPELEFWFSQILAELKEVFEDIDTHTHVFADLTDSIADGQVPQSAVTQHQAALAITTSQVTSGTFADARIAESNVTQHEAALAIAASQVAAGTFQDGLYTFSRSSDEHLRLDHASATGSPSLEFYQDGTRRAYIRYVDSGGIFRFRSQETGKFDFRDSTNALLVDIAANGDLTAQGDVIANNIPSTITQDEAAVNFGSAIAQHATGQVSFTVTGAAVGDGVHVLVMENLTSPDGRDWSIVGTVSAADTVIVGITNHGPNNLDASAVDIRIIVHQA